MRRTHKVFVGYFSTEYPKQHIKNLVGYFCPNARNIVVFRKSISSYDKLASRRSQVANGDAPIPIFSPYARRRQLSKGELRSRATASATGGLTACRIRSQMAFANDADLWPIGHSGHTPVAMPAVDHPPDASHLHGRKQEVWFCCILFPTRKFADEAIERLSEIEIDGEGVTTREWIERHPANERRNINASRFIDRRARERRTYSFTLGS